MTTIRKIVTSQVDGNGADTDNTDEIRPYGEMGLFQGEYIQNIDRDRLELLIFDGKRTHLKSKVLSPGIFYGSNADSGDNLNRDTIKLIPDTELYYNDGSYGNDQYLVIDPTAPNHIHIRAGGTMDNSGADLFLGGEQNHVSVSDSGDTVVVSTDAGEGNTQTWVFDNLGNLLFPSNLNITPASNIAPVSGTYITQAADEILTLLSVDSQGSTIVGWIQDVANPSSTASIGFNNGFSGSVDILTGDFSSTLNTWTFDVNGDLTVPNYINFKDGSFIGDEGGASPPVFRIDAAAGQGITLTSDTGISNANHAWLFDINGDLTIPGSILSENNINIDINLSDSTLRRWTFGEGGDLTFPDGTVQSTAFSAENIDLAGVVGTTIQANGLPVGTRFTQPVPTSSLGQTGDTAGTVAFNGSYIYYCTANYNGTPTLVSWSNVSEFSDGMGDHYVQADIATPSQLNGVLYITNVSVNGAPLGTETVTSFAQISGNTYKFYLANSETWQIYQSSTLLVQPNIWKRVAWSGDTW